MAEFVFQRSLELLVSLLVVSLIVFLVVKVLPGDPAQVILGLEASPESLQQLRSQLGLDRPLHYQYGSWLRGLLSGDLGESIFYRKEISQLIVDRLQVTIPLTLLATLLSVAIALPLGTFAARHHRTPSDFGVMALSQLGMSIPAFWLGILLLLLFAVRLNWLPVGGFPGWATEPLGSLKALVLPVTTLAVIQAAALTRMTRSATLEVLSHDYVAAARSKGVPETKITYKHVLANSIISIITLIGLQVGQLLAGAVVIETVFNLPGLGRLMILAVQQRDLLLVMSVVTFLVGAVIVINFLVDLAYGLLDPRIRLS